MLRLLGDCAKLARAVAGGHGPAAVSPVIATAVDFAAVDPDEVAAHGWMVAVRAHGPGRATLVRPMAVGSARSVPRAVDPGRLGIEAIRVGETMMRAVAVFVGRAV